MKNYAPYLLYQIARFGALSVPQMLQICQGKCKRSSLYRALGDLTDARLTHIVFNSATRTRAYTVTKDGRATVYGKDVTGASAVRERDLDHTLICADVLLSLCLYKNVSGISTQFEMSAEEANQFCFKRIPDGVIRLTQNGQDFELAVEVETSVKNSERISEMLEKYWQTFRKGMECSGLIIASMSPDITGMYTKAIRKMPEEFQTRVKLLEGTGLSGIRPEAFGDRVDDFSRCLDLTRTSFLGEVRYSPTKAKTYLSAASVKTPIRTGPDNNLSKEIK